jgi:oligo-1,6-glucosidase
MSNIKFDSIQQYKDIESISMYQQIKNNGGDLKEFMEAQKITARDNGRTPMQWNNAVNAGFSTATPWLPVNKNYADVNVEAQEKNPNSTLNYFRKMIQLRKQSPTLVYGKYQLIDKENPDVYAYTREWNGEKLLILLSFCNKGGSLSLSPDMKLGEELINNYESKLSVENNLIKLKPWQAVIVKIK